MALPAPAAPAAAAASSSCMMPVASGYIGRFAPSPTGPLHAGSVVAALASWLDARAQGGRWLVRIEDVDTPRCAPGTDGTILAQLQRLGLAPDQPPTWQSHRGNAYQAALDRLAGAQRVYPCRCTRADIARANQERGLLHERHGERVYPGTCRARTPATGTAQPVAWRLRVPQGPAACIAWTDRRLGPQLQCLDNEVGDFVLRRADGVWTYQLAVVVDDAAQGITDVVRGEDLADNTPRQLWLQRCLGLSTPRYLHTPLVRNARGEKLSKQNGAPAVDLAAPLAALRAAGEVLGLQQEAGTVAEWLAGAVAQWQQRWPLSAEPPAGRSSNATPNHWGRE
jgi:glutamyl-Q tRNA(Asp) synthetase